MSNRYDGATNKSVRLYPERRAALDRIVDHVDEVGNESDAIRTAIDALDPAGDEGTNPVTDGGDDRDVYEPDHDRRRAVYRAVLQLVDDSHVLPDDDCGTVARLVSNDGDTPYSPDADAVRRVLRRLRPGYAYLDHRPTSVRYTGDNKGGTIWRIKPEQAVPEKWKWNAKNVRERKKQQRESRTQRMINAHRDDAPADD